MFRNRDEAGTQLAEKLVAMTLSDPVVLALPRGGVPVALPVARALAAPIDLLLVRKIGVPGQPELAAGAVVDGAGHDVVFNTQMLRGMGLSEADFDAEITKKLAEIEERRAKWCAGRPPVQVKNRDVIVVDDGVATGATVKAALKALAGRDAARVILALPVAPPETMDELRALADEVICLETPPMFYAVGAHYADFAQVEDDAVTAMLAKAGEDKGEEA